MAGSTSGIEQRDARLDQLEPHRPLRRGEDDLVEMVLAVGVEAAEDEVGAEAGERDRRLRRRWRDAGSLRRSTRPRRPGAGSRPGRHWRRRSAPVHLRSAWRGASGSKRASRSGRPRKSLNHCAQSGAHVVGGDAVAPDLDLGALLDPIDGDVHGEHAGRAQDQLVRLQRRLHERHARQLALRHEAAGGVDDQPLAIEIEAGLGQRGLARRAAGARFDGVDVDRFERHVEVGGDGGSPRWSAPPQRRAKRRLSPQRSLQSPRCSASTCR